MFPGPGSRDRDGLVKRPIQIIAASLGLILAAPAQAQVSAGQILNNLRSEQRRHQVLPTPMPRASAPQAATPGPATSHAIHFVVRRIRFVGAPRRGRAALQPLVAPYLNRRIDFATLQQSADRVAEHYQRHGRLVHVLIPAQDITAGVVTLRIVQARLGAVVVHGAPPGDGARMQDWIHEQVPPGKRISLAALERGLLLLDDLPEFAVSGSLARGSRPGLSNVDLQVARRPSLLGAASVDDYGSSSTGRTRMSVQLGVNGVLGFGTRLDLSAMHSSGTNFVQAGLGLPLGDDGWRVGIDASRMQYKIVGSAFQALAISGDTTSAGMHLSYPLLRSRPANLLLRLGWGFNSIQNSNAAGEVADQTYDTRVGHAGIDANWLGAGINTASLRLSAGSIGRNQLGTQSGGGTSAGGNVTVGSGYTQNNGSLAAGDNIVVGGNYSQGGGSTSSAGNTSVAGNYTQSGGLTNVSATLAVNGAYAQSNGTTIAGCLSVGQGYDQIGGNTSSAGNIAVGGNYSQSAGNTSSGGNASIGGNYTQGGGTTNISGTLGVANNYTQSNGSTHAGCITIGGGYAQTGGNTSTVGNFSVGNIAQGGSSSSVGVAGPGGGFLQRGGNLSIGGNGSIGSSGNVTLNHVSSTGGLQVASGGGSIQRTAGGSISTGGSATFTAPYGTVSLGSGNSFGGSLAVTQGASRTSGQTTATTTTSGAGGWVFQQAMLVPLGKLSGGLPVLLDDHGTPAWVSLVPGVKQRVMGLALPSVRVRGRRNPLYDQDVQRSDGRLLIVDLQSDAASGGAAHAQPSHPTPEQP